MLHTHDLLAITANKFINFSYFDSTLISCTNNHICLLFLVTFCSFMNLQRRLRCKVRIKHNHPETERTFNYFFKIFLNVFAAMVLNAVVIVAECSTTIFTTHWHPIYLPALLHLTTFAELMILHLVKNIIPILCFDFIVLMTS